MKLDDSSRKTSPRHFEEENPDVRQREKYMQVIQTRKTLNKYNKYINQTRQKYSKDANNIRRIHLDFS